MRQTPIIDPAVHRLIPGFHAVHLVAIATDAAIAGLSVSQDAGQELADACRFVSDCGPAGRSRTWGGGGRLNPLWRQAPPHALFTAQTGLTGWSAAGDQPRGRALQCD